MPNLDPQKLALGQSLPVIVARNSLQQLKTTGAQARPSNAAPNPVASQGSLTSPQHVQTVQARIQRASDITTKVTVTFQRNPQDYLFIDSRVFVTGYKGNSQPVQVASGQSPVSFSLENTGEPVTVSVQASGNLGQAPISTAPTTTLTLPKTPLATTPTDAGNGTGSSGTTVAPFTGKFLPYSIYSSQTSLNNTGTTDVIVLVPFSLPGASQFGHIVVDKAVADTNHAHLYDVGIYTMAGALKANLGATIWDPIGVLDAAFLQGTVSFVAGEYLLAFTGGGGTTLGAIQVNNMAGLSFGYTTVSTSTSGVLPSSIAVVEGAAATGFGAPPYTPVMILY